MILLLINFIILLFSEFVFKELLFFLFFFTIFITFIKFYRNVSQIQRDLFSFIDSK